MSRHEAQDHPEEPKPGTISQVEIDQGLFESAFEDSQIGTAVIKIGHDGTPERVVKVNPALAAITGMSESVLLGSGAQILGFEEQSRGAELVRSTGTEPSKVEFEHTFEKPDQSRTWVMVTLSPLFEGKSGSGRYRLAQIQDISDRRKYQSKLHFLAEHDPLTGLVNVRRFYEIVDNGIAYQTRYGGNAALVSFDLDRFKLVNDSWGHGAGDELLKKFALALTERVRDSDTVARLGGDEFAVFLPGSDSKGGVEFGNQVLDHLRDHPTPLLREGVGRVTLSCSGGVTTLDGRDGVMAKDLLAEADASLYAAKRSGRNCVVNFKTSGEPSTIHSMRLTWAERTRRALDRDGLFMEAQPIRDMNTGEVIRYEVLLRMDDPDIGVVYPSKFLYTAERFGLSGEIDDWVVKSVIDGLAESVDQTTGIAMNLTAASFDPTSDLVDRLPEMMEAAGVDPSRFSFELTEGTCLTDIERARKFVEEVHRIGCKVALDDFGSGFGGFYYLKMLPVDTLKIEGEFIRSVNASREDRLIVKAVSDMANGLGIETVAEFVSTAEIAETCKELGITAIQGEFAGPAQPFGQALGID